MIHRSWSNPVFKRDENPARDLNDICNIYVIKQDRAENIQLSFEKFMSNRDCGDKI